LTPRPWPEFHLAHGAALERVNRARIGRHGRAAPPPSDQTLRRRSDEVLGAPGRSNLSAVDFSGDDSQGLPVSLSTRGRRIYRAAIVGMIALGLLFLIFMTWVLALKGD
jgi:hypothetical protein